MFSPSGKLQGLQTGEGEARRENLVSLQFSSNSGSSGQPARGRKGTNEAK